MDSASKDNAAAPEAQAPPIDFKKIRRLRRGYLALFLVMLGLSVAAMATGKLWLWLIRLPFVVAFFLLFLWTVYLAFGYHIRKLALPGAVILLIPFVAVILVAALDTKIYKLTRAGSLPPPDARFCVFSWLSVVLLWVPAVGLAFAIVSLVRISRSGGRLRGEKLAGTSLLINAIYNMFWGYALVTTLLRAFR